MAYMMRDAFVKFEECHSAWLHEWEFVEVARALKALAIELGEEIAPAIDELAQHGLEAALATLARRNSADVSAAYLRHRAH